MELLESLPGLNVGLLSQRWDSRITGRCPSKAHSISISSVCLHFLRARPPNVLMLFACVCQKHTGTEWEQNRCPERNYQLFFSSHRVLKAFGATKGSAIVLACIKLYVPSYSGSTAFLCLIASLQPSCGDYCEAGSYLACSPTFRSPSLR